MKCPNCGELIKEKKLNFCGFCGSNLKTGEKSFTAPVASENQSLSKEPKNYSASAPSANVNTAPPINTNYASPFEQMVKANAAAQGVNGFQTSITPPSFDTPVPAPAPEAPVFTAPPAPFESFAAQTPAPETKVSPVQAPVSEPAPAPVSVSPISSFDPSSLAAFNPYNTVPETPKVPEAPKAPETPAVPEVSPVLEKTSAPVQNEVAVSEDDAKTHDEISKQLDELNSKRSSFEPSINISKNVKIRNASDNPDAAPITYMEYTKSTDEPAADNKFSSFSFAPPQNNPSSVETDYKKEVTVSAPEAEPDKKAESKTNLKESLESVLNFTTYKSSVDLKKEKEEAAKKESPSAVAAVAEAIAENEILNTVVPDSAPEKQPEPVQPEPAPIPEPQPEPEVVKEKVINYIGQDRRTAEQMLSFKGLAAEIEYAENEKEFDFVIAQSIPADTDVLPGTVVKLTVSAGTWSEWAENPIPVSSSKYITETKTEYRRRNRTRTLDKRDTTDTSEFEDYTLTGQDCKYSDWETDQYYTSEAIPPGDTCEIIRMTSGFKYAGWFNPANMNGMSFSSPDVANFFNTNLSNVKWSYEEIISMDNVKPDVKNWKLVTDNMTSTPAGDPMISNIFFSAHVVDGKSYAMKYGSAETEWYIYKRRSLIETIYHFEKEIISDWSEWTEWSETEHTPSEDCQIEVRTLSRSRRKLPTEN